MRCRPETDRWNTFDLTWSAETCRGDHKDSSNDRDFGDASGTVKNMYLLSLKSLLSLQGYEGSQGLRPGGPVLYEVYTTGGEAP